MSRPAPWILAAALLVFLVWPHAFAGVFQLLTRNGAPPIYGQTSLLALTLSHLALVGAAVGAASVTAVGLGILVTRPAGRAFLPLARTLANIGQTFPPVAVLALAVFLGVTILGFIKNGGHFLELFWVKSAPLAMRPVLAIIELISYFVRPLTQSIRLAGNIMAGHAVLKVFAAFAAIAAIAPVSILAIAAMYGLELLVAVIQAYVFTILTCVYLKDALHPVH